MFETNPYALFPASPKYVAATYAIYRALNDAYAQIMTNEISVDAAWIAFVAPVLTQYADAGASDSEPIQITAKLLRERVKARLLNALG
jgi:hypothetical protein